MVSDQHRSLSPVQQRLLAWSRAWGTGPVVGVITLVSIVLSVAMTALSLVLVPADREFVIIALIVAVIVPSLVAPAASVAMVHLLHLVAAAHDELQVLAATDALTGIHNRRRYFELGERMVAARRGAMLVGMVDLDRFKQINDAHGHAAGDAALIALARRLQHAIGGYGIVARIGGDEFALLLEVDAESRSLVVDALHHACRDIPLAETLRIDASLGLDDVAPDMTLDGALGLADRALYAAKAANRRRVDGPTAVLRSASRPA